MAYQLPPPMWQAEEVPHKEADWPRPREEAGTITVEGDVDLECPLPLQPHLQELLGGEEPSLVGAKVGDSLPPLLAPTSPPHHCHAKIQNPPLCAPQSGLSSMPDMCRCHLSGRSSHQSQPHRPQRICLEGVCLLQGDQGMQLGEEGGQLPYTATSTSLHQKAPFPSTQGCKVWYPGYLPCLAATYHHLCRGSAALGQEGASLSPWLTLLPGEECAGALVGNGSP